MGPNNENNTEMDPISLDPQQPQRAATPPMTVAKYEDPSMNGSPHSTRSGNITPSGSHPNLPAMAAPLRQPSLLGPSRSSNSLSSQVMHPSSNSLSSAQAAAATTQQ